MSEENHTTTMPARIVGRTSGLDVSALGLGCMGMSQGYGRADDDESAATLRQAVDAGITLFDTAQSYGSGHNERLLGRALADRRDEVVLATKMGIVRDPDGTRLDGRPEHVRGYCEASLERLGVEHLDLYYLHRLDPDVPVEETVGAMAELVTEGKVGHLGISEVDVATLERAAATHPIAALQFEWSLWWREPEDDVVPAARRLGVGLVPYSPLGRGFLTGALGTERFAAGDFRAGDPRFAAEQRASNEAALGEVRRLAGDHGVTPAQLALAWLLAQGDDVVPIPGTRHVARVEENVGAVGLVLGRDDLARLESVAGRGAWAGDRRSFAAHGTVRRSDRKDR